MFRSIRYALTAAALLAVPAFAHGAEISREDFMKYLETQDALQDERVLKMPEAQRIPKIAAMNFKMKGPELQAILDRVEAAGGKEKLAAETKASVESALKGTEIGARLKEVRIDTSSPHVVTYVKWQVDTNRLEEEAALIAAKLGQSDKYASTFYFQAVDGSGADVWRAKLGADRTNNIKEERIKMFAKRNYYRFFEVERDARN